MNLFKIIADLKALAAAIRNGDWFGDNGVIAIVQRLLGYFNQSTGPIFSATGGDTEAAKKEFNELCIEFAALKGSQSGVVTETVGLSLGFKSILFNLVQGLLDEVKKLIGD